jgi:TatA/E family protein of Tat protein translocase
VFAFILESLGTTELLLILAIALIFFGPRKLPQLARSMGKGLAEFRKASDDFKRTWEREVALESGTSEDHSLFSPTESPATVTANVTAADTSATPDPQLEPANSDWVIARDDSPYAAAATATAEPASALSPEPVAVPAETNQPEPLRKHDYL